jgi:hypothetical protein
MILDLRKEIWPVPHQICELNYEVHISSEKASDTHKQKIFLTHTNPKMCEDVDSKRFGNLFILGTKEVSWIYCSSIIHHDGYITHFFFYL